MKHFFSIRFSLCLLLLAIIPATAGFAHGASADLAARIRDRYQKLESFEADFVQTLTHRESGAKETRKGELFFAKPLLIHWQTATPSAETLIVNDKEIWDYLPDEGIAYRYSPQLVQDSRRIIQVLTGQAALTKDFDVKPAGAENGLSKLLLYPREPTAQMVEAVIWVDPDSGYIRRANVTDFYGNTNDVRFEKFKPGVPVPASRFRFSPPAGAEVEDRMDKKIEEKELFR